jgi:hypothetical protein
MYINICIYMYIYIYKSRNDWRALHILLKGFICKYIYINMCVYIFKHICCYIDVHTYIYIQTLNRMSRYDWRLCLGSININIYTYIHIYVYIYINLYSYIPMYIFIHAYTHIHKTYIHKVRNMCLEFIIIFMSI